MLLDDQFKVHELLELLEDEQELNSRIEEGLGLVEKITFNNYSSIKKRKQDFFLLPEHE